MHFGSKNRWLLRLFVLLLTVLLENDYNLAFSLEMDPIDEGNNDNTDNDDNENNIPPTIGGILAEETIGIVVGVTLFLFIVVIFWAVPVKTCLLLPFNIFTLFKIVAFISYLFLLSIFDSSYFNMCYLSDQDVNVVEVLLEEFIKEEEDLILIEDSDEEPDVVGELDTALEWTDCALITVLAIVFGSILGSVVDSILDQV